ncbi:MAG: tail fiber protein [Nocardioides sp.]|nr:tail fiber protein [Nocardioides sp.]
MSIEPHLGEIMWVPFNFAPKGWALCNGQLLPINQNQALFALLGTQYGGNGQTNFALPDLRGRTPIGQGVDPVGLVQGAEFHTLTATQMPAHTHTHGVSERRAVTGDPGPGNPVLASGAQAFTAPRAANAVHAPTAVSSVGGSQPHPNMQPFLTLTAVIAIQGIFPSAT